MCQNALVCCLLQLMAHSDKARCDVYTCCSLHNSNTAQTLDEVDFSRGIWTKAMHGNVDAVHDMLQNNRVDVNMTDNYGYTGLHYAARNGHIKMCRLLMCHGAAVNAQTSAGQATALHRASFAGHLDVVHLLVQQGANVTLRDADLQNSLHKCASQGHARVYEYLLGVDATLADARDKFGKLPSDYLV